MRLAFLTAILGTFVLATGTLACGDSSSGGNGGSGGSGSGAVDCASTSWDCAKVCSNLNALCDDATCGGQLQECGQEDCVASCNEVKGNLGAIPEAQKKPILADFNCLAERNACVALSTCIASCLR